MTWSIKTALRIILLLSVMTNFQLTLQKSQKVCQTYAPKTPVEEGKKNIKFNISSFFFFAILNMYSANRKSARGGRKVMVTRHEPKNKNREA